jgi:glyoxylate/hydroxypyruvate reductase A
VGVIGIGQLCNDAAIKLIDSGLKVVGWSRTPRNLAGVETLRGDE